MILKIFSPKKSEDKIGFLYSKHFRFLPEVDRNIGFFKKNANFVAVCELVKIEQKL
jgi:hypothetical protein